MGRRAQRLVLAAAVLGVACAPPTSEQNEAPSGEWRGTIETEGTTITVRNESGSVWGGPVELVEEVVIGSESGRDEYLFGQVTGIWATDERIIVADAQVPAVRVYDAAGRHLFDVGRRGEGPGEYETPSGVAVTPTGDILVVEHTTAIEVYGPEGEPKATWNGGRPYAMYGRDIMILGDDGAPWVRDIDMDTRSRGRSRIGPEGMPDDRVVEPDLAYDEDCLTYTSNGRERTYCSIPFIPRPVAALAPDGSWVVGVGDAYRFEVRRRDGSTLVVERAWEPVPVSAAEAAYRRDRTTSRVREAIARDPSWTWNGPEIPDHKPAFTALVADRDGRVWAVREGPSRHTSDCGEGVEPPCWERGERTWDAFGDDGRYLGSFTAPEDLLALNLTPVIEGRRLLAAVIDDGGTIRVKRFRIVLPGD